MKSVVFIIIFFEVWGIKKISRKTEVKSRAIETLKRFKDK